MHKPLTLAEALAKATSRPRRATLTDGNVLYHVSVQPDGSRKIVVRRIEGEPMDGADPVDTGELTEGHLPETGWVPGASLRFLDVSPAYADDLPDPILN